MGSILHFLSRRHVRSPFQQQNSFEICFCSFYLVGVVYLFNVLDRFLIAAYPTQALGVARPGPPQLAAAMPPSVPLGPLATWPHIEICFC